jgi:PAS domain S-box-containing protein
MAEDAPVRLLWLDISKKKSDPTCDLVEQQVKTGCQLVRAASLNAGLRTIRKGECDLVLIHCLAGQDIIAQIDEIQAVNPGIPILLLLEPETEQIGVDALRHGAVDYVINQPGYVERLPFVLEAARLRKSLLDEHVRVRRDFQKTERRFRVMMERSSDALLVIASDGRVTFANSALSRILGYSQQEVINSEAISYVHPDDLPNALRELESFKNDLTKMGGGEVRLRGKDGNWYWFYATGTNLYSDPAVEGVVINLRDIREQKLDEHFRQAVYQIAREADQAVRLEDMYTAFHRIIAEVMPAKNFYIALYDFENDLITCPYFTDEIERLQTPGGVKPGRGLPEYVLRTGKSILVTRSVEQELVRLGEVERVGIPSPIWLGVPLLAGDMPIGVMAVWDDENPQAYDRRDLMMLEFVALQVAKVTARKKTEDALRQSEERFRGLFENSSQGIYRIGIDGEILLANPALLRMLGFASMEELRTRNLEREGVASGFSHTHFEQLFEKQDSIQGVETTWEKADGSTIFLYESARVVRDDGGSPLYFEGMVEDITERKRAGQQFAEKLAALRALAEIDREILAASDANTILDIVCNRAAALLHAPKAILGIYSETGRMLIHAMAGIQDPDTLMDEFFSEWQGQMTGHLFDSEKGFSSQQIPPDHPAMKATRAVENIQSLIGEPYGSKDGKRGILVVFDTRPRDWSADDAELLRLLGGQVAIALEKVDLFQAVRRRVDELEALHEVTLDLTGQSDLPNLLKAVVDRATGLLKVPAGFVFLYDKTADELELTLTKGAPVPLGLRLKMGEGLSGRIAQERWPMSVESYGTWESRSVQFEPYGLAAVLGVPIQYQGELIGVLVVAELEGSQRKFTQDDSRTLSLFASQVAGAVYASRLYSEIDDRSRELDRLYRASSSLITGFSMDLKGLCDMIVLILSTDFQDADCSLWLLSEMQDEARLLSMTGPNADMASGQTIPLDGSGLIARAVKNGQPLNIADITVDPDGGKSWPGTRSELIVPLEINDRIIGVIDIQSPKIGAFRPEDERLLNVFSVRAALMLDQVRLSEQTNRRLQRLTAMRAIDIAIVSSLDLRVTLNVLLEQINTQLHADACSVLLFDPLNKLLEYTAGRGFYNNGIKQYSLRIGEGLAGGALIDRGVVSIPDLSKLQPGQVHLERIAGEGFVSYFALPLVSRGQVKGVIELFYRSPIETDAEWLDFLETLSRQVAIAIEDASMFESLQRSNFELTVAYDAAIEGWARALDMRVMETEGHTRRVTRMAVSFASAAKVKEDSLIHIYRGSLLHDVGKLILPDEVLFKKGEFDEKDWVTVRRHPALAYEMLYPIEYLRPALAIPYCHHENWDGSGYPRGLKGEQIPLEARIFALVDVWDALCSDRPYRKAWSRGDALEYIHSQAGKKFDPALVELFMHLVESDDWSSL